MKSMDLEVQVVESSFVTPAEPAPAKRLWLSCLDVAHANRGHTPTIYLYSCPSDAAAAADFFDVDRLKEAMARALVAFYPLAGRLGVSDDDGRAEISCNGEGALFVVAQADDLTVEDVKKFKPSPELRRLFVPRIEPSSIILAIQIQVTSLKCGGVALGTVLHHAAIDASSAIHFFQTWNQVASLKHLCGGRASTFCALSALIWQCMCVARRLPPDSQVRFLFAADLRRRMRPPLPSRYFGNAVFRLFVAGVAGEIGTAALGSIATRIKGGIERMDDELVRSAIDYFEMAEMDKRRTLTGTLPQTDMLVSSWLGRPQYDADFGWGKPEFMSQAESVRGGYVYFMSDDGRMDNGGGNGNGNGSGDVHVLVCMEAVNIDELGRLLYTKL